MGQMTPNEALALRWAELCADPRWHDLGGKLELNGLGVIEMSAATWQVFSNHGPQSTTGFGVALAATP